MVSAGRQCVEQAGRGQDVGQAARRNVLSATNMYGLLLRLMRADGTE